VDWHIGFSGMPETLAIAESCSIQAKLMGLAWLTKSVKRI